MRKTLAISLLLHIILFSAALLFSADLWKSNSKPEDGVFSVRLASLRSDSERKLDDVKGHAQILQKARTGSEQKIDVRGSSKDVIMPRTGPRDTTGSQADIAENRLEEVVMKDSDIPQEHPEVNSFIKQSGNLVLNNMRGININNEVASYKNIDTHDFAQDKINSHRISQNEAGGNGIALPDVYQLIGNAIEKIKRYPLLARKRGIEGTVFVTFRINPSGEPHEIKILRSSGYNILDRATLKVVEQAAPYPVVDNLIEVPVAYKLRN